MPSYSVFSSYRPSGGTGTGSTGNAFGSIPAPTAMPNPFSDLSKLYPNLSNTNAAVSQNIMSKLQGELSPQTISAIQDAGARFGVSSGMPGAGLSWNKSLRDLGLYSEMLQQQGIEDYNATIPTISGTQTVNPALQAEINTQNNLNAAAPDPAAAASYAQELFDKYLAKTSGPAGGTGAQRVKHSPPAMVTGWGKTPGKYYV